MPHTALKVDPQTSDRIRIARVICIVLLVYVHTPPFVVGFGKVPHVLTGFDALRIVMIEALSRSSVPLLSVISGYLLTATERGQSIANRLMTKARVLLVPLVLWNLIAVLAHAAIGDLPPAGVTGWINRFTALSEPPLITPLYFLRDVYLSIVLYPVFAWGLRRSPAVMLAVLAVLTIAGIASVVFINPFIPLFFVLGLALGAGRLAWLRMPATWMVLIVYALAVAMASAVAISAFVDPNWLKSDGVFDRLLILLQRGGGALFFWWLAGVARRSALAAAMRRIEPWIFLHFCAHTLTLGVLWRVLKVAGVGDADVLANIFFLTAPITTLAVSLVAGAILARLAPGVLKLLLGGRLPGAPRRQATRTEDAAAVPAAPQP